MLKDDNHEHLPDWEEGYKRYVRVFWFYVVLCVTTIVFAVTPNSSEQTGTRLAQYNASILELAALETHPFAQGRYDEILFELLHGKLIDELESTLVAIKNLDSRFADSTINLLRPKAVLSANEEKRLDVNGRVTNLLELAKFSVGQPIS
ncbi:MAG: hypothetical protein AAGB04_28655, partial [Pseudomonadota bacterium]